MLTALDPEERKLFCDRIRALDRRIMPGVSKLNWLADKHALEFYYKEARKHCRIADGSVCEFKAGVARIDALCKAIAEGLLINVEKKKLYDYTEFEAVQAKHHTMVSVYCRLSVGLQGMRCRTSGVHGLAQGKQCKNLLGYCW